MAVPTGDRHVEADGTRAGSGVAGMDRRAAISCRGARRVLARLHGLLLHVTRRDAARRNRWLRLSGPDLDDLARQAATHALTAITAQLGGFRGQSRFRTWASEFADVWCVGDGRPPLLADQNNVPPQEDWDRLCSGLQPDERAERNELPSALRLPSGLPGAAGRRRRAARPARSRDDRDGGFCYSVRSARGLRPHGPHRPWS